MLSYACLRYLNTLCICYSSSRSLCNLEIHLFDISANISSKGCPSRKWIRTDTEYLVVAFFWNYMPDLSRR